MSQEKENFLDRWSRLKQDRTKEEAKAPVEKKDEPAPALPPVEQLKPESDFKPFMDPRVDTETRRAALKKMFGDAHFNTIDPFEPYSVDLTKEDPIPDELLKTLNQARRLIFDEKESVQAKEQSTEESHPEGQDGAGKQDA